uniref:Uncharacterized protein n=1 Tax=Vitis vinifera TaxID=29760 RepID=A5B4K7_VITVI|nr:hypothetical protein VITISV_018360 [Vitis vinifera]
MGFPRFRTEEAPRQAGVNNIELMMEWLFSHPRETHKDDELARSLTMSLRNSKFDTKENLRLRKFTALVDDLLAEGVLTLDIRVGVFVWVGQTANPKEKHNAFEIGQKHIEIVAQLEDYIVVNPTKRVTYASHTVGSSTMAGSSDSALKLDRRLAFHGESISLLKAKTAIRRLCSLIGN